jgi:excisionase family DNA binding protein
MMKAIMHAYLLRNLGELAHRRAIMIREEAQLWDILSRDLTREAKRIEDSPIRRPPVASTAPLPSAPTVVAEPKLMVSIAEAGRMMGIGRSKLYTEINEGRLRVRKSGRRTLIAVADIEAWCRELADMGDA